MRKLLRWLTRDDVARTNAAQASVRLQHRRQDRDDTDAFLAQHRQGNGQRFRKRAPNTDRRTPGLSPPRP
jgi:hypothetical protein